MLSLADYQAVTSPRKTIQPPSRPATETTRPPAANTTGFSGTAPELDWATFEQQLLNPYLSNGYLNIGDERGQWAQQLGMDVGGKPTLQVGDLDWASFNQGADTGNLAEGMPVYAQNPNAAAQREAAYRAALANPDTIYTLGTDRIGAGGVNAGGGNTRTDVQYRRVGNKLVPVAQRDFNNGSLTQDAIKGGLALAGAVYGLNGLEGIGGVGGGGGLSGMDLAADAALGSGNNIITAGQALGAGGATAGAGAGAAAAAPTAANATNPALIESAVGTPGYGASSAGAGGAAAGSTLPSWMTSAGKQLGGRMLTSAVLGGLAGTAAAGSSSINTADRQGVANTLQKLGLEQADIARNTYADAQGRINFNDGKFDQILASALDQAQKQGQRSDQLWSTYASDFLPAAQKFAQTAMNYDTAGRRDEAAAAARAAVETESNMQRQAQQRALARGGVSLDAGRALALDQQSRFDQTKLSTGAASDARRKVEETGLNLLANTANIGQGIVGTSQQQAGQAITAGNAAAGTLGAKESARNAALAPTQAFYGGATSATGNAGNVLNSVAATEAQNQASRNAGLAGLGQLAGTVLTAGKDSIIGQGLGAIGDWLSDPKSKTVHGKVSGKKALADVEDAKVKKWTYKPGMGDGGTHEGRMAGKGDPMGPDGMRRIDPISEMGKLTAAVQTLAKDVKTIKRRLSLADA